MPFTLRVLSIFSPVNPDLSLSVQDRCFRFFSGRVDPGLSHFDTTTVFKADGIETLYDTHVPCQYMDITILSKPLN